RDRLDGRLERSRVEVGLLDLRNLLELRPRDLADLIRVRRAAALADARGLLQQDRGGRRLRDEREAAVAVDRDDDRGRRALLHPLRRGVERLAELHDVHAVLTERGPYRGARIGLPRGHLQLDVGLNLPCHREPIEALRLLYLTEIELDGRRAAQNLHRDSDFVLLVVDVLDDAAEIVERTVGDPNDLSRLEQDLRPRLVHALLDAVQDRHRLALADRRRLVAGAADEPEDLRHLFHEMPGLVVHFHLYEHVAREELALALAALAFPHLDDLLGRHENLAELVLEPVALDPLLERLLHLVLVVRVRVDDVPLQRHAVSPPGP